ncbi:MAG: nuclear transport factor 2 family protein [Ferruginibacter sp.]
MMIKFPPTTMLIMAVLFSAICSTATAQSKSVDMVKIKTEIQAMEDAFAAGEKAKDANAVAMYYADDAISYPRERAPEVGKAAIKAGIAKNISEDTTGNYNVYKVVDLFTAGDMVVEIGSWNRMNSTGTSVKNGHYMSYLQRRNGKYVCVRDMSVSSSAPMAAMKTAQ